MTPGAQDTKRGVAPVATQIAEMTHVEGGSLRMGSEDFYTEERCRLSGQHARTRRMIPRYARRLAITCVVWRHGHQMGSMSSSTKSLQNSHLQAFYLLHIPCLLHTRCAHAIGPPG